MIAAVALVVPDYDPAIRFFCDVMRFRLVEDIDQGTKRWVTVEPAAGGVRLVLARAENDLQRAAIGNQAGGRVWLFLQTQDFAGDDSATTLSESSPRARNAVLRQTSSPSETSLRAPSGILVIAAKDKPTVDQVAEAISELHQSFSADLNADALLRSRSPVIFFNRFQVNRVECKGKRGWAYIVIDSEASLAGGTLEKAVRHEEQHWEMRKGKSGWTVVVPAGDIYVPRAAAVRIFAQQLARLTDGNESLAAASMDSQESHLASLLNGLLNN